MEGCLFEAACLDDTPAQNTFQEILKQFPDGYKRRVTVGAGNANNGDFETFNQSNTTWDELHTAVIGSSSIPGIFKPTVWKGMSLTDGGTRYNINLISAVEQCLELVEDQSQIILDIAICMPETKVGFETSKNAGTNYFHGQGLHRKINNANAINW